MATIKNLLEPMSAIEMLNDGWEWDGTRKPELIGEWVESLKDKMWFVSPLMRDVVECWRK